MRKLRTLVYPFLGLTKWQPGEREGVPVYWRYVVRVDEWQWKAMSADDAEEYTWFRAIR
jgi:hypothetical protein